MVILRELKAETTERSSEMLVINPRNRGDLQSGMGLTIGTRPAQVRQ